MIHPFTQDISNIPCPTQFTYPFHYTPHPLCVLAVQEVQTYLQSRTDWHCELQQGKMFGVLVVRTPEGTTGWLAAFSGNLAGSNHHEYFVPPVYDLLDPNGYFKQEEARISELNRILLHATHNESFPSMSFRAERSEVKNLENTQINATEKLRSAPDDINALKEERKARSIALQQWIFQQFRLRNALGEEQNINEIFERLAHRLPPAGTGECAAPKLLQHAYLQGLQPLSMAEFWWGNSPKGEIRRHGHYYPSCRHKCEPILNFMLQGLDVEPNPLLVSNTDANQLETVYEDDYLLVVNKPAGMLSVPGKIGQASVLSILQERYPDATGPILVHRLDMATSGLLLAAKDKDTHAELQKQFESRSVKKRYIALLDGIPSVERKGFIRLPMRPDFDNRPLQMVDFECGKAAVTRYEILSPTIMQSKAKNLSNITPCTSKILRHKVPLNNTAIVYTRIAYYPETGRTHQLRVHSAHPNGMNCPIVGDPLYGQVAERLYLHAEQLEFRHPQDGHILRIQKDPLF